MKSPLLCALSVAILVSVSCGSVPSETLDLQDAKVTLSKDNWIESNSYLIAQLADFRLPEHYRVFFGCRLKKQKTQCKMEFLSPGGKRHEVDITLPKGSYFSSPKTTWKYDYSATSAKVIELSNLLLIGNQNIQVRTKAEIGELFQVFGEPLKFRICSEKYRNRCKIDYDFSRRKAVVDAVYSQKTTIKFSKDLSKVPLQIDFHSANGKKPFLHIGYDLRVRNQIFPAGSLVTAIEFNDGTIFKQSEFDKMQVSALSIKENPLIKKLENLATKRRGEIIIHLKKEILNKDKKTIEIFGEYLMRFETSD